jgi:hypothetical protein
MSHHHHHHHHHVNHHKHPNLSKSKDHHRCALAVLSSKTTTFEDEDEEKQFHLQQQKDYRHQLEEAIKYNPYNTAARSLLAHSLAQSTSRTQQVEAQHHAKTVLRAVPSNGEAYYAQGLSNIHEHADKSIHAFDKALLYNSSHRGMIHVARDKAKQQHIKKQRDFISTKIRDKTSQYVNAKIAVQLKHNIMFHLLLETDVMLQEMEEMEQQDDQRMMKKEEAITIQTTAGIPVQGREPHDGRHGMLPVAWTVAQCLGDMKEAMPHNVSIEEYYESGQYEYECEKILTSAKRCLQRKLMQWDVEAKLEREQQLLAESEKNTKSKTKSKRSKKAINTKTVPQTKRKKKKKKSSNLAVMNFIAIDLDDTTFNSFAYMQQHRFQGGIPHEQSEYLLSSKTQKNEAVADFVSWIHQTTGVHCLFFTERPVYCRDATISALQALGLIHYEDILWCASNKMHEMATAAPASPSSILAGVRAASTSNSGSDANADVESVPAVNNKNVPSAGTSSTSKMTADEISHHPHFRFAGKTIQRLKQKALKIFTSNTNSIERRIIAIVGDQDSDFPSTSGMAVEGDEVLQIKLPNYLYTVE